jgi:hypothetical protein
MQNSELEQFEADMKQFLADRSAAFLSMDKPTILAYAILDGVGALQKCADSDIFWISVHMARTAATDLPMAERVKSKQWLNERGYRSMDDGDVSMDTRKGCS